MSYLGSWAIDDALTFYANTTRFDTGAATDADSVPSYRVYEDETTSPLLTGSMALLDSANTAGFYSEQIALSAANGFEAGKQYAIYIAATVNLVAGASHHTFQVGAKVNTMAWNSLATVALPLVPTVAGRALDVSAAGEAGVDWANVGTPGSTVALSATTVATVTTTTTATNLTTNNDKTGYALSAASVTAIWAELMDGTRTAVQAMRGFMAALLGKASGLPTAPKYRDIADAKNVIDAVTDTDGNRTAVTLDLS